MMHRNFALTVLFLGTAAIVIDAGFLRKSRDAHQEQTVLQVTQQNDLAQQEWANIQNMLDRGACPKSSAGTERYWTRGDLIGSMQTRGLPVSVIEQRRDQWNLACGDRE